MLVCPRCKTENDDGRIRCGSCGNNISKRGDYLKAQGPAVIVLGSVEDLRRARETGNIDLSEDDPTALGWLEEDGAIETAPMATDEEPRTRRVSVRDIDKISGLHDLRDLQKSLLGESPPTGSSPIVAPSKIDRPLSRRVPSLAARSEADAEAPPAEAPPAKTSPDEAATAPERSPELDDSSSDDEPKVEKSPTTAYLLGELFPQPFELTTTRRYLMGRDPRASIFLPSGQVSRRHAGIAADPKGDYWIEDLRSTNGTYLNGHAIVKRRLRQGDEVQVGPFAFRFAKATPGQEPASALCDPNSETQAMRAVPGALSGDIDKTGVPLVLALLYAGKRNGVLTLRAGRHLGRIFFVAGHIQHAQFGRTIGDAALAALIPAEGGLMHFCDEKVEVKQTVTKSTKDILGEWLRPPDAKTGSTRGRIVPP
ncbi:FHA domain-containing protein [bacterium]|nr:FHA domain-containing protein [bacterium]